jgi:glutamine synthetase
MDSKSFVAVCFSDLAGQVRGHGVPRDGMQDLYKRGLPWPVDLAALTVFGEAVETPWQENGGLCLHPDAHAQVTIDFGNGTPTESFVLGTIQTSDHKSWGGCTRSFLQATLDTLKSEFGLDVSCTYEHQFSLQGDGRFGAPAMSLSALRREREFANTLATVLENAGISLLRFGAGLGGRQFTATTQAKFGVSAADSAVIFRQIVHATAEQLGQSCSFAPLSSSSDQNGVILGIDLFDDGDQVTHDSTKPHGISVTHGRFIAGVLRHLPALTALTRPSILAGANGNAAGSNEVGALQKTPRRQPPIMINPAFRTADANTREYGFAFTQADATACPYLQLGALLCAGLQGLREALPTPAADALGGIAANGSMNGHCDHGGGAVEDLAAALIALSQDHVFGDPFPDGLLEAYTSVKQAELVTASRLSPAELGEWSQEIY